MQHFSPEGTQWERKRAVISKILVLQRQCMQQRMFIHAFRVALAILNLNPSGILGEWCASSGPPGLLACMMLGSVHVHARSK